MQLIYFWKDLVTSDLTRFAHSMSENLGLEVSLFEREDAEWEWEEKDVALGFTIKGKGLYRATMPYRKNIRGQYAIKDKTWTIELVYPKELEQHGFRDLGEVMGFIREKEAV